MPDILPLKLNIQRQIQEGYINIILISTQWKELYVPTAVHVLTHVELWEVKRLIDCFAYISVLNLKKKKTNRSLWFPFMVFCKHSNELGTLCLLWHGMHTHTLTYSEHWLDLTKLAFCCCCCFFMFYFYIWSIIANYAVMVPCTLVLLWLHFDPSHDSATF